MKKIIERFQREKMDEKSKNDKVIENFQNEVIEECQRRPIFSFDKKGKFVKEFYDPQKVISQVEKILSADFDERFVKCPGFDYLYDSIILDVLVDNRYARIFCHYGSDHPAAREPRGLVLEFSKRGMLLKKALQSVRTKEQEVEENLQL